jgi:hypothetical protein
MIELTITVKAIDAALISNLQTRGDVFDQPEIDAAPEVEPRLRCCALPKIKAIASSRKRLHSPAAFIAEEVVRPIDRTHPYRSISVETPVGACISKVDAHAYPFVD